ncbi:peptide deformylase [Flavobacteriaceae bacterium]|jgi:peptide deformylase|nr:peptide deformylase [Flavobacteriales bacterium]MBL6877614.1 peptide deformylase [Flavobacteriaceae bacterium]MDA9849103.1 peptide deformylase [Flavobacteriaceae bacterium]MDC1109225.1 peptide deformylase [Flavobacteriaceae bacterium]RZP00912.1 MAG: peptide deformylase [Flavobacteriales bacterium]|tara:strand:- start:352 stop:942 length:591 start_codon:yes stop_codon:yes gene_type:complete
MILPIIAYGHPVLKRKAEVINKDYPKLKELIENMFETMYNASGVGIAAPQIGLSIRLFIVDTNPFAEDDSLSDNDRNQLKSFKKIFINPIIIDEKGDEWSFEEGCLSIPNIREGVLRQKQITIQYHDENFNKHTDSFDGLLARVIQHEYDHIEGVLFTDKLSSFKKQLLKKKLLKISSGKLSFDYEMKYFKSSKKK